MIGLVIAGGKSTRMGTDKSWITYYKKPQVYEVYEMLQRFCTEVYISCNESQSAQFTPPHNTIIDGETYKNMGPMASLLTAFNAFPKTPIMTLACDYPLVQLSDLQYLYNHRDTQSIATVYKNEAAHIPEPLIGIYESAIQPFLLQNFSEGKYSLKELLITHHAKQIIPSNSKILKSIDTPEDRDTLLNQLYKKV
jgi:molybdopterin-guanine dinucleotide biosynthesis protein A